MYIIKDISICGLYVLLARKGAKYRIISVWLRVVDKGVNMVERDNIIKIVRDEWQSLYHHLSSEARVQRIQQWLVVICCIFLFAGTVGFMHTQGFENLGRGERQMLSIFTAVVLAAGLFFLTLQQLNIRNSRRRALEIENKFLVRRRYRARLDGWEKMQLWGAPKFINQFPYYILFILTIVAGFLFVHWYLRSPFLIHLYSRYILHLFL